MWVPHLLRDYAFIGKWNEIPPFLSKAMWSYQFLVFWFTVFDSKRRLSWWSQMAGPRRPNRRLQTTLGSIPLSSAVLVRVEIQSRSEYWPQKRTEGSTESSTPCKVKIIRRNCPGRDPFSRFALACPWTSRPGVFSLRRRCRQREARAPPHFAQGTRRLRGTCDQNETTYNVLYERGSDRVKLLLT